MLAVSPQMMQSPLLPLGEPSPYPPEPPPQKYVRDCWKLSAVSNTHPSLNTSFPYCVPMAYQSEAETFLRCLPYYVTGATVQDAQSLEQGVGGAALARPTHLSLDHSSNHAHCRPRLGHSWGNPNPAYSRYSSARPCATGVAESFPRRIAAEAAVHRQRPLNTAGHRRRWGGGPRAFCPGHRGGQRRPCEAPASAKAQEGPV